MAEASAPGRGRPELAAGRKAPPVVRPEEDAASFRPVGLWRQLQLVALLVQEVQAGRNTAALLDALPPALRPGIQALGFEVLRNLGVARWLRCHLAPRKPPPLLDALLCSALALAWAQTQQGVAGGGYTDFTLVNQAVEAAKRNPRLTRQAGLVNGVLRRFLREHAHWAAQLQAAAPLQDPALLNVPAWWWQRLQQDHGNAAAAIVHASLRAAPMSLRIHARHAAPQQYLERHLQPAGLQGCTNGAYGVTLRQPCSVLQLPGFAQGWVSVQDAAAQLAAPLLLAALPTRPTPLRLLDACAAPGGKTAHLLELCEHHVTALDVDPQRCSRIHDNLQRLGLHAQVVAADAADPPAWWDGALFDGILLDAPCTASGIVRRHPDVPWLRRPDDVAQLAAQQRRLLEALWPLLAPDGVLLYCTCSVFREEGQQQMDAFLLRHSEARLLPSPGHLLPLHGASPPVLGDNQTISRPSDSFGTTDHDGFFYALLARQD